MFSTRYTVSSRPLQAKAQNFAGLIMDGGHHRRNPGLELPQSYAKVQSYSIHPFEYASPCSSQISSPSKSHFEHDRLPSQSEFHPTSQGSPLFSPRHLFLPSSTTYSRACSLHEGASHGQLRQGDLLPTPDYNDAFQQPWSQTNPLVKNLYGDQQFLPKQSELSSSSLLSSPMSPDNSLSAFGFISPSELAVEDITMYGPSIQQRTFSSTAHDHESLASQQPGPEDFPSLCLLCNDQNTILQDQNFQKVHYWTKHTPPAGSPDAWAPMKCLWEGCKLEKDFKTLSNWLTHVSSVHQKGYNCSVPGCLSKPFGSQADVKRHHLTKHTPEKYCTKAGCQARRRINLCRKDKMDEHEAMWHGPLMCEVVGCPRRRIDGEDHGFSKRSKLDEHMRQKHPHLHLRNRRS